MSAVNKKWSKLFPNSIGNQTRSDKPIDNTQAYETDGFPQFMENDPVRYDLQNAILTQSMSNDERLKEKIDNIANTYVKKSGDTMSGALNLAPNTKNMVGNDAYFGDMNNVSNAGAVSIKGIGGPTSLCIVNSQSADDKDYAQIGYSGKNITVNKSIDGNITGTAAKATKLATARTISLIGNVTGSATFDGSGDVSISTTVNKSKYAVNADVATTADNADKLTSESGSNYLTIDTDENSWSVIGSNPGNWLKSIRTETDAPPYSLGDFSAAIAFGGGDTKGIITHAFDTPNVKFAGGNGSTARWKFSIYGGFNNDVYDLNDFPTKTGGGASGTWGINISGNAASATNATNAGNADTVDGYHASDLLRTLGGNRTPVITDIFDRAGTIDMSTMSAADKAKHKANINKAQNMTQNIWNNSTGIHAYGGDLDMNGYSRGALKLTQSYKNFDKILIVGCNDDGNSVLYALWDVWELAHAFAHSYCFHLFYEGDYWFLYGSVRTGTDTNYSLSTDTIWNTQDQNAGIIAIYGIKY